LFKIAHPITGVIYRIFFIIIVIIIWGHR